MTLAHKRAVKAYTDSFAVPGDAARRAAAADLFAPDAVFHVCHPFNDIHGVDAYFDQFIAPLSQAMTGLVRRDDILMGGTFEGGDWVTSHGNYLGHFAQDVLGLTAPGRLEYLRVGEFHRFEGDRIVESYIYLDLPQLMIATGQWPITDSPGRDRGYTGLIMGPASQDGLLLHDTDPEAGQRSYQIVTDMLSGLATPDEAWRPYWHDNMVWYGPAAFGSFVGIDHFAGFQVPFENAFS